MARARVARRSRARRPGCVAVGLAAALALGACGQPTPSDDAVGPTVSVEVQPTIAPETPTVEAPDTTAPVAGGLFDASTSLVASTCAPTGDVWNFTGTVQNADTVAAHLHRRRLHRAPPPTRPTSPARRSTSPSGRARRVTSPRRPSGAGPRPASSASPASPSRRSEVRLFLVRHGQTHANVARQLDTAVPGLDLTDTGQEQARALAERLAGEDLGAIYTSDLVRTQQTAAPLAERLGLEMVVLPGLREIQAGDYEMSTDWQPYVDAVIRWGDDPEPRHPRRRHRHQLHDPLRRRHPADRLRRARRRPSPSATVRRCARGARRASACRPDFFASRRARQHPRRDARGRP